MKTRISINLLLLFIIATFLVVATGCQKDDKNPNDNQNDAYEYKEFSSFADFRKTLDNIAAITTETIRLEKMNSFWDSLKINKKIPFVLNDSVAFLYKGAATSVKWAGDFNGWNPNYDNYTGVKVGESDVWIVVKTFPLDARLDYKIVKDGSWILDPANTYRQYSGFGPNSELRMQSWIFPEETLLTEGANRGTLSDNFLIQSIPANLGYSLNYKVYTPFGYTNLQDLPVVYVTDGHEYADDKLGAMIIVMDNLIHQGIIKPIIAVFIDPREPGNASNNRRMAEYIENIKFANFVADELVPTIDANFKTSSNPENRAILGTSLGGWNSAFFGLNRSETFHLIGIHSPAFGPEIIQAYSNVEKLPLKIFMSTGVIFDTEVRARAMKVVLESKQYPLHYIEVNQGHSWGNWRALIDEPLTFFFPAP
ncbi:MAG: alpha/beta hydrolase-fold protein [Bacteroidales bacterium]|jgi:enterochelin esterase family protein|nr:alpha/beta hydrolase-fold protein [Bacteroidales bacterium]MDD4384323.1 alpha/beta hydrolase-fold protein [Bacteroidales bacterium]MDY0198435.1 alpha/beta hydrolase-fold protein [Tenuifilaceae bacterium]